MAILTVNDYSTVLKEMLPQYVGDAEVESLDLRGLISLGKNVTDSFNDSVGLVKFGGDLFGRLATFMLQTDKYEPSHTSLMRDSKIWGTYIADIYVDPLDPTPNPSYNLVTGQRVEQDTITAPTFHVKVWNSKNSFEIPYTISDKMLRSAFLSVEEFASFVTAIEIAVDNTFKIYVENLSMSTRNNFIAMKYENATDEDNHIGIQVVNLLSDYNTLTNESLTVDSALRNKNFLKYCVKTITDYISMFKSMNTVFNIDSFERFTSSDRMKLDILSFFAKCLSVDMESEIYHNELVSLNGYEEVPFWQGLGDTSFENRSKISVVPSDSSTNTAITVNGVVGLLYDERALGVTVWDEATTSHRNDHGEYTNYWRKHTSGQYNNLSQQGLVFVLQDEPLLPVDDEQTT